MLLRRIVITFLFIAGFIFGQINDTEITASISFGEDLLSNGKFKEAIAEFERILEDAENDEEGVIKVACLLKLGLLHWIVGELDISYSFYEKARAFGRDFGFDAEEKLAEQANRIHDLYQKGKELTGQGKYRDSIETFNAAIDVALKIGSKHHELKCKRWMSINYWEIPELKEFYELNVECNRLARRLNHVTEIGRTLNHLGLYDFNKGNFSKSINSFSKALEIFKGENKHSEVANILNNLATIYMNLGSFELSLHLLLQTLDIDRSIGNISNISMDLNNLGELYRRMATEEQDDEKYRLALARYIDGLKLARENNEINTEIRILCNLGNLYLETGECDTSLKYSNEGIKRAILVPNLTFKGMLYNNIGYANLYLANYKTSISNFKKAIEIGNRIGAYNILWEAHSGLGQNYINIGDFDNSELNLLRSIELIERLRSRISLDRNKTGFVRDKVKVYTQVIDLYYQNFDNLNIRENSARIFFIVEKAKARAFMDFLNENDVNIKERFSHQFQLREKEISERISYHLNRLRNLNATDRDREIKLNQLASIEGEYMAFLNKVRVEMPELADVVSPEPYDLAQIQNDLLDDESVILEYYLGEPRSYMFAISSDSFALHTLPPKNEIQRSLRAYLKILSDGPSKQFKGEKAAARLLNELISPARNLLNDEKKNLIIVPDGILFYLPFESLIEVDNERHEQRYLVRRFNVSYMPSASSLLFLKNSKKQRQFSKDLLALGDPTYMPDPKERGENISTSAILFELYKSLGFDFSPIPHSGNEVKAISKNFEMTRSDIFLGENANELNFKKMHLEDYKIIHFACHGFIDEIFPLRSAMVLSRMSEGDEDGFLQAQEIYNLKLGSELVVLSACQTGRGKIESGEGVLGLHRVFFFAGARSVISTLWEIGDKPTALFMDHFYKNLASGNSKSTSLRLAKMKMMESKYSHPFYWAAFVLSGDYKSTIF